jgi:hypothetical protein
MRRFLTVLILLLCTTTLDAQVLRFDAETVDFGTIKPNVPQHAVFRFVNTGADTLNLLDPRPSCGCTAALLSSHMIAPGDSGSISVDFHAVSGMYGSTTKTVSIYASTERGEEKLALLRISANVVGDVVFDPGMLRFRTVIGRAETLRVTLTSDTDKPLPLDNITASLLAFIDTSEGNAYHADRVYSEPFTRYELLVGAAELPPRESTDLVLVLQPEYKGQINGMVRVVLPHSEVRIPVTGVVLRN